MSRRKTKRYLHVLDFIRAYKACHGGSSPTLREIGQGCGISSTSVVDYALRRLEENGHITRQGMRQITILEEDSHANLS
jgi:repressor LexA